MPRSTTGNYSLASPSFVPQSSIINTTVNADYNDIATALTQSVATTGVSPLTGPILAADGIVTAPSYSFASSPTTGFYVSAANEISMAISGAQAAKFNASGITFVAPFVLTDSNGTIAYGFPIGIMFAFGGVAAPLLCLMCYGQAVSRVTYSNLFSIIGTTYGAGDTVTTFNVPDLRGRLPFGKDNMGGSAANRVTTAGSGIDGVTLGASGGTQNVSMAQANMPNYNPVVTDPTHGHNISGGLYFAGGLTPQTGGSLGTSGTSLAAHSTGCTVAWGSSIAQATMNPALIINYIIYAGV